MWGARIQASMIECMVFGACLSPYKLAKKLVAAYTAGGAVGVIIPSSTLAGWREHYLWFGETPSESRQHRRYKRNGRRKMRPKHLKFLHNIIKEDPNLYLDEIRQLLKTKFGKLWSTSTIWKYVTGKKKDGGLNMSLQVITMRAVQANELERLIYKTTLSGFDDPSAFIFIDETCVGRNDSRRRRCWSTRGIPPSQKAVFKDAETDGEVYTMIAAADINGFIANCCTPVQRKSNASDRNVMRGTIDQIYFLEWVKGTLCDEIKRRVRNGLSMPVIVMDNATVHKHADLRALIKKAGGELVWTAAYSPDLNPIERCFNQYKSFLKANRKFYSSRFELHLAALTCVDRNHMINYYNGSALEDCIQNVPANSATKRKRSINVAVQLATISLGMEMMKRSRN